MRMVMISEEMPDGTIQQLCGFLVEMSEKGPILAIGVDSRRYHRSVIPAARIISMNDIVATVGEPSNADEPKKKRKYNKRKNEDVMPDLG